MKKFNRILLAFMLIVGMSLGLTSCTEDPYIDIIAVTSCSPDLLEFVTPTVEIIGDNGEKQSYVLSSADFTETEDGGSITVSVTINGQQITIASTVINNIARSIKRFDDVESMKGNISVSYTLKPDYTLQKEKYIFFHNVGYRYNAKSKEGIEFKDFGITVKPIANEVDKEDVKDYLNNLISKPDGTSFSASVAQSVK